MTHELHHQLLAARLAARDLANRSTVQKDAVLRSLARALFASRRSILAANAKDFERLPASYPHADRLRLTDERLRAVAEGVRALTHLPDPTNRVVDRIRRPNGLLIEHITVPIGVLGVIYEARPNVTVDVVSLALKSGNAVVLKGGRDAATTNAAIVSVIHRVLRQHKISTAAVTMLDPTKPALTRDLLRADGFVDVLIPRGSQHLIDFVRAEATVPTIETGAGVCHTYVERTAKLAWAVRLAVNAKVRRPSVCNALDTLLVDRAVASRYLTKLAPAMARAGVKLYADPASYRVLKAIYPQRLLAHAKPRHFGHEFLALQAAVKVVPDWRAALAHIQRYTSGHSEAIVTQDQRIAERFTRDIDAAAVYVNAPTSFTDGFEFGLGAEIGISTQKLHARGPMGLRELTSTKWVVRGRGQARP